MDKKVISSCILLSLLFLISGCETTKGVAQGIGSTMDGVAKDSKNLWQMILKADGWMKENLW